MRMSCNGCRVLRKRCSESCILRPSLDWINTEQSQSNATLFLAKFYGRTPLLNLITMAPPHSRPALLKSLLYEACGRLSNPIYGAVGLLCSGNWEVCQAGVDSILDGSYQIHMSSNQSTTIVEQDKINVRGKFECVNHRKKKRSKELQLLKSVQNSREGIDRTIIPQHKYSSQHHNDFLRNPNVDGLYVQNGEGEIEVELTLGASSPPTHKLAD